jgi:acylphosphatase
MNYQTISDIYEANDKVRAKLKGIVEHLNDEQVNTLPDGEKWTVKEFVEHISIVDEGIMRISAKMLNEAKANGRTSDGAAKFSGEFVQKIAGSRESKFEAPDRVRPTGTKSIAESLAKMDETRRKLEELRPLFESVECSDVKFPHPAFGDMTAHEWLALLGGHETRHIKQIQGILEKIT